MVLGAGEGGLELTGEVLGYWVAHPVADVGGKVGRGVEDLVGADSRGGRADHVADGVAAGFAGGQPNLAQEPQNLGALSQRDVVELDVFTGGDVALAQRGISLGDVAQRLQGLGGQDAAGDFDAHHLDIGLTLPVDALAKAKRGEFCHFPLAGFKGGRFLFQTLDLGLYVRNDPGSGLSEFHALPVDFFLGYRLIGIDPCTQESLLARIIKTPASNYTPGGCRGALIDGRV